MCFGPTTILFTASSKMRSLLIRSTYVLATSALATGLMVSIADPASAQTQTDLKARCAQLTNFLITMASVAASIPTALETGPE